MKWYQSALVIGVIMIGVAIIIPGSQLYLTIPGGVIGILAFIGVCGGYG